uniref:Uncharacterized protein n=1 Tax=Pithovirus LCPAC404 TaxID=2506597 RepID=A0A481ZEL5_9VIRU|nr:MAG: hypothetical protein LCPAC404_02440 [Pithovirus LCPAC404]
MAKPETIKQLYSAFLEEHRVYDDNTEKSENLKKLEKELRDHADYLNFHPHNDFLQDVPRKVVLDFFVYLSVHRYIGDNVTLALLRKFMRKYVMAQTVLDLDVRAIVDKGWAHHMLADTGPCGAICEYIELSFYDLLE